MTDKVEEQILVNQAIIMSGIDTLVCTNSGITPAVKRMLHEAFDDAISQVWSTVEKKGFPGVIWGFLLYLPA